ncbi:oligosaccharide flippase family protein, partial [Vibrio parahaemolyticus]|uniref:oligosaccharide flippase family protein n=1 Tax=Vibrio parahaemolyticus TaxID=670 RepID=UPI00358F2836
MQFLLLSVYARIFSPEIFGLITSVVVIISFFQLVLEGGMSVAIIEQKKISSRERDGVFTSCSLIGLLLFVV